MVSLSCKALLTQDAVSLRAQANTLLARLTLSNPTTAGLGIDRFPPDFLWKSGERPMSLKAGNFYLQARTSQNQLKMGKYGTYLEFNRSQEHYLQPAKCTFVPFEILQLHTGDIVRGHFKVFQIR